MEQSELDNLSINTIRMLAIDAVERANSGHPGLPMGAAAFTYALWTNFLRFNPKNPTWINRDRFVLSAGHGSMLLYSLLHLTGYGLKIEDLENFRQWHSKTPGHPEYGVTPGVETTTGPLGQGFANAVGMAVAEKFLAMRYNKPNFSIIDYTIYVLVSDGDLMEGISSEAASYAGSLQLDNLICLYDCNNISIEGSTSITFQEDAAKRFEAYGWHTQTVEDGNDLRSVGAAISNAKNQNKPSLIILKTHIGFGSPHKQDTAAAHGSALGEEEVLATKKAFEWPEKPTFYVPNEVQAHFNEISQRGCMLETSWNEELKKYTATYPELGKELLESVNHPPQVLAIELDSFTEYSAELATREASGNVMNQITKQLPLFIGGSADLAPSNSSNLIGYSDIKPGSWKADSRNLHFGVREHAMGGILNGIALTKGIIPFGATFLCFSDYMRPAIRLAAIMKLGVVYVFTHDSIAQGEDGTTHQPIEHLASLRAMPGLVTMRPADANETLESWKIALQRRNGPTALILTRQKLPILDRTQLNSVKGVKFGAYIIRDSKNNPDVIIIATGSEVSVSLSAANELEAKGYNARIISMPSTELFEDQSEEYRESVLPSRCSNRLVVEAASSFGWHKYSGNEGEILSIDTFGESAPGKVMMEKYGFTPANIVQRAESLISKNKGKQ